jgi:sporulation protein YhbH
MASRIERDDARYQEIIKGRVRRDLKEYISNSELLGRKGKNLVSIPIPRVDIPHFRFDPGGTEGVGQGEGDVGDVIGRGQPGEGSGAGAGDQPGAHIMEVELTLEELAQLLGELLELPHIEPRGKDHLFSQKDRYTSIRRTGPETLRHFKRTYKHALKRQIASGDYNPKTPRVIPIREDKFYRSWKEQPEPQANAAIIYMMDVSGSMGREQKEIVRTEIFWIETWLRSQYRNTVSRYIVHDVRAQEVDQHTFYHLRESGGTAISSAYLLADQIIDQDHPLDAWNIYAFHFSDGDNWNDDIERACQAVKQMLPKLNMFGYGQVRSYGSGQFVEVLRDYFAEVPEATYPDGTPRLITSLIPDRDAILDSIKDFLGKGN